VRFGWQSTLRCGLSATKRLKRPEQETFVVGKQPATAYTLEFGNEIIPRRQFESAGLYKPAAAAAKR
jgi:hypothetical protein